MVSQIRLAAATGDGFVANKAPAAGAAIVEKSEGEGCNGVESCEDFENFAGRSHGVDLLFEKDPSECHDGKRPEYETLAAVDF